MAAPKVKELVDGYSLNRSQRDITGTRSFIGDSTGTHLPVLGAAFSLDLLLCTARKITESYYGDSDKCPKRYDIEYSTLITEEGETPQPADYHSSLDISVDYLTVRNSTNTTDEADQWEWQEAPGNEPANEVTFHKREVLQNYVIKRAVYDSSLANFLRACIDCIGCMNQEEFLNIPKYLALFVGATVTQSIGSDANRKWNATLNFLIRSPEGTWTTKKGWNLAYRVEKDEYQEPKMDADFLYPAAAFGTILLNSVTKPTTVLPFPNS
jgi:hypothetical protein